MLPAVIGAGLYGGYFGGVAGVLLMAIIGLAGVASGAGIPALKACCSSGSARSHPGLADREIDAKRRQLAKMLPLADNPLATGAAWFGSWLLALRPAANQIAELAYARRHLCRLDPLLPRQAAAGGGRAPPPSPGALAGWVSYPSGAR